MKFQDYYQILGVRRDASADEIKKAYRKLALEWHPDRHKGASKTQAEAKFKEISEAYAVLSDAENRKKYDQFGADWQHGQEFQSGPRGGGRRPSPEDLSKMFGGGFGFSDFFASMFGEEYAQSARQNGHRRRRAPVKGVDAEAELEITISQATAAPRQSLELPVQIECAACDGLGEQDGRPCPSCAGVGSHRSARRIELALPRPLKEGARLRLKGLGEPAYSGGESGDLYLTIHVKSDSTYRVDGLDVYADVPIAPWEAIAGGKVDVVTLDGVVTVRVPADTRAGAKLRLAGRGLAGDGDRRGDFFVVIRYHLPDTLSAEQKEALLALGRGATGVRGGARGG